MLLFSSFPSLVSGKDEGDGLSGDGGGQAIFVSIHLQLSTITQKTIHNNNNNKHTFGGRTFALTHLLSHSGRVTTTS